MIVLNEKGYAALLREVAETLRPFAHPDLCKSTPGGATSPDQPVYGRDKAVLKLGDFQRAAGFLIGIETAAELIEKDLAARHEPAEPQAALTVTTRSRAAEGSPGVLQVATAVAGPTMGQSRRNPIEAIREEVVMTVQMHIDAAIRQRLIEMGWTPPAREE